MIIQTLMIILVNTIHLWVVQILMHYNYLANTDDGTCIEIITVSNLYDFS